MAMALEQMAFGNKIKRIQQVLWRILNADMRKDIDDIINDPIKCGCNCGEIIKKNNNGKKIFYFERARGFYFKRTRDFYLGKKCLLKGVIDYRNKSHDYKIPLRKMAKEAREISYEEMLELSENKFQYRG